MSQTITIASGETLSSAAKVMGKHKYGTLIVPTIDVCSLTWAVSDDDVTYFAIFDPLGVQQITASSTGARAFQIPSACLAANYIKISAGASQTALRTMYVILSDG